VSANPSNSFRDKFNRYFDDGRVTLEKVSFEAAIFMIPEALKATTPSAVRMQVAKISDRVLRITCVVPSSHAPFGTGATKSQDICTVGRKLVDPIARRDPTPSCMSA